MAVPDFPPYACIQLDGYSESADFGVIRSEMDGLAKQRPRWSKPIVTRTVKVKVGDRANKLAFDAFVRNDLAGGSGWFNFTDPVDGVTKQGRLVSGTVQWSTPGRIWFFNAQIESIG
ncbi:hypothetical protein [Bordetella genomosp. 9]|uniref:Phage tail protein n=1 Tax=Bordetella genomosp. 9 TaxID=1416803 RepID=A0A1W6YYY3_9BORD|nr:hypothetical protein [Bordetella genomosp. 9]ARP86300.1 hypothetical protein CAL13_08885 [Bordetella genomosp. 9]ARP89828.1 hypothetical protein CAL14_05595 [Bordetella genomosp. 9]